MTAVALWRTLVVKDLVLATHIDVVLNLVSVNPDESEGLT